MITAVDTSVLVDILVGDERYGRASAAALRDALAGGGVVACDVVWAEIAGLFSAAEAARDAMSALGVDFAPMAEATALAAGMAWKEYRRRGGRRDRVVADFLIGAHAATQAERLLTRDRGFYRTYFARLSLIDPSP